MDKPIKKGIGFGITSGIITTIGLMMGLYAATNSKLAILGGIITIAIADSLSDSFGIHISEEFSGAKHKNILKSSSYAFLSKLITASLFIFPIIFLNLKLAILICSIMGILLLIILNYFVSKENGESPIKTTFEHISLATIVIILSYFIGKIITHLGFN